ncbi:MULTISPECIES: hypothetical protein [unclassified Enterococcus]|uniref:hypothetical protein n=1 Tax=unclassified Enterococcus TaxID=2608891 RepID=UPI0013EB3864|nr:MULTISPECIES: hypothetical protein [unclassified Enterococcus]
MIRILMAIATLLLLFVSYYLFQKQKVFFVLIKEDEKNHAFLQFYGSAYAFLGVLGILAAFFNQRFFALLFLFLVILVSATFSIRFAKKIAEPKQ